MHFAHVINPVSAPAAAELSRNQPVTFESMRVAQEWAAGRVRVDLLSAQFPEDRPVIPGFFRQTADLRRSVLDLAAFSRPRKLPLLRDLLDRLYEESAAEYLIYTNVDIALQPQFYLEVARRIAAGHDALMINRRRLPDRFEGVKDLPKMYASPGRPHPGFDCFIFHRDLYPRFQLADVCIGIPYIEIVFSQNLFCFARNFQLLDREFLTFHLGMEIFKRRDPELLNFNRGEFHKAIERLWPDLDSRRFPWGDKNFLYRMIRWGLHPAIPIRLSLALEPRRWRS